MTVARTLTRLGWAGPLSDMREIRGIDVDAAFPDPSSHFSRCLEGEFDVDHGRDDLGAKVDQVSIAVLLPIHIPGRLKPPLSGGFDDRIEECLRERVWNVDPLPAGRDVGHGPVRREGNRGIDDA